MTTTSSVPDFTTIVRAFPLAGRFRAASPHGSGHINDTYAVSVDQGNVKDCEHEANLPRSHKDNGGALERVMALLPGTVCYRFYCSEGFLCYPVAPCGTAERAYRSRFPPGLQAGAPTGAGMMQVGWSRLSPSG